MAWWQKILDFFLPVRPPVPVPPSPVGRPIVSMFDEMNKIRASQGLDPFLADVKLDSAATAWANAMAGNGVLAHGDFAGRIAKIYPNRACAENIAYGRDDALETVYDWMESPGHRANILGPYHSVGCGRGGKYWCADFLG